MGTGLTGSEFIHASWIDGIRAEGRAQGLREAAAHLRESSKIHSDPFIADTLVFAADAIERLIGEPAPRSSPVTQDELMDCYQYGTVKGEPAPAQFGDSARRKCPITHRACMAHPECTPEGCVVGDEE